MKNFQKLGVFGFAVVLGVGLSACETKSEEGDDEVGMDDTTTGDGDTTTTGDGDTGTDTTTTTETGDGDTDTGTSDTTGELMCATHDPIGGAAVGEACSENGDCDSQVCVFYQDSPPVEGSCDEVTAECRTRVMGRVLDFSTRTPVADHSFKIASAIGAASNPAGTPALISPTTDANGEFDAVSDAQLNSPLGIVAVAGGDAGYFLTATGVASPADGQAAYGPAGTIRDLWVVPEADLTVWSAALESDPEFTNQLPLGEAGGIVGLVRDVESGDPIADASVVPIDDTSGAVIRYLNEAGDGFTDTATSTQGVFVIVKPGLGEEFDVEIGGVPQNLDGTGGSANGAVFTLIFNVQP